MFYYISKYEWCIHNNCNSHPNSLTVWDWIMKSHIYNHIIQLIKFTDHGTGATVLFHDTSNFDVPRLSLLGWSFVVELKLGGWQHHSLVKKKLVLKMTKTLASRQCLIHSLKIKSDEIFWCSGFFLNSSGNRGPIKPSALISIAIESSIDALVSWTNALTDMHELLTNGLTPLLDTTNTLTDTDELLTKCLMPHWIV